LLLLDKNYINSLLDTYSLNVTNLSTYLKCPVSFYYNNLIRVPAARNEYLAFGIAVHGALDRFFKKMLKHDTHQFPGQDVLLDDFYWYMKRNEDSFTTEQYKRRIDYGREILPAFYDKYINDWSKNIKTEESFRNIEMDGIPMSGKLDKLEMNENTVNVIDYKTGKYENAKKKLFAPVENFDPVNYTFEEKYGGDYWRQAVFYKILVENDKARNWQVVSTEFNFVEPDKKSKDYIKHKIVITPQDVAIVKEQIKMVYTGIKNHEFSRGCNEEDCVWCNFVKQLAQNKPFDTNLSSSEDGN
jgi:DNA helicase-2/ATP-dependent DNA helicase PcrA